MSLLVLEDAFSCAVILRRALATAGRGHDCKPACANPSRTTFGLTLRSSRIARNLSPCPNYGNGPSENIEKQIATVASRLGASNKQPVLLTQSTTDPDFSSV